MKINATVPPSSMPFSPREYDTPVNAHGWSLAGDRRSWFRRRTGEEQWIPGDCDIEEDDSTIDWDLIDEVMASSG
ncbi:hypothetical protein EWM64_g3950 [Hericium alpestre]|uniref:Uncharacterized protein n=1 Tax=Hericium alpestre TaxID=135208 RepID=A0A4Z0A2Z1_9AGAM|nr:hypothetical protein EWM64_g3950 [Hericium alpestre]